MTTIDELGNRHSSHTGRFEAKQNSRPSALAHHRIYANLRTEIGTVQLRGLSDGSGVGAYLHLDEDAGPIWEQLPIELETQPGDLGEDDFATALRAEYAAKRTGVERAFREAHADETTLQRYPDASRTPNYSTYPTNDVPVLKAPTHCENCGGAITWVAPDGEPNWSINARWRHVDAEAGEHRVHPRLSCIYCGSDDASEVRFSQHSHHDQTACSRCGGVNGFPIGD